MADNTTHAVGLGLLALLLLSTSSRAQFTYVTNAGAITLTKYTGLGGAVTIPPTITGRPVTSIGDGAFEMTGPTSVSIPNSVTNIGDRAFKHCSMNLTSLAIPSSVLSIGEGAFSGSYFQSITIPDSVRHLGNGVFSGCGSLFTVTLGTNVPNIGDSAFWMCSALVEAAIPSSVTNIGVHAFGMCSRIASLSVPGSVRRIGAWAFEDCSSLESVTLVDGLTSIGFWAFRYCTSLTSITLPKTVTNLEETVFLDCQNLSTIAVDPLNPTYSSLDGVLFNKSRTVLIQCPYARTGSYAAPSGVTHIASVAFQQCGLNRVTIPDGVTYLGDSAFASCGNLLGVYFQGDAPSIGTGVFEGDDQTIIYYLAGTAGWGATFGGRPTAPWNPWPFTFVTNNGSITITRYTGEGALTIPAQINGLPVTVIGEYACSDSGLTSISIPSTVVGIAANAFDACSALVEFAVDTQNPVYSTAGGILFNKSQTALVRYPPGKTGDYAVPIGVTSIGNGAFADCFKLTGLSLPHSVGSIGERAFERCSGLTHITIPDGVANIGSWAFRWCEQLSAISVGTFNAYYMSVDGVLYNKTATQLICCPEGKIGSHVVRSTVTTIGDEAFAYLDKLDGLYFPGPPPSVGISVFTGNVKTIVYYLPGIAGWTGTFSGRPTAVWKPRVQTGDANFGVRANQFGFNIAWASGQTVVVEACTNLADPVWSPLQTNTLAADWFYFSDRDWTNHPGRFYRVRWP